VTKESVLRVWGQDDDKHTLKCWETKEYREEFVTSKLLKVNKFQQHWKYEQKYNYVPKYGFYYADCYETHNNQRTVLRTFGAEFRLNWK
jgi:hypothetical protein